jgi:hypothetical protein
VRTSRRRPVRRHPLRPRQRDPPLAEVQLGDADTGQLARALDLWAAEHTRLPVSRRLVLAAEHIGAEVAHAAPAPTSRALGEAGCPLTVAEMRQRLPDGEP